MSLGWYLFDGFPEGAAGVRDLIEQRRTFLAAMPLGRGPLAVGRMAGWATHALDEARTPRLDRIEAATALTR